MTQVKQVKAKNEMATSIAVLTSARVVVNATRRFPYAFLEPISRQLGVPLLSVQNVMSVQAGVGATSPLLGALSERYGRKRVMMAMLLIIAISGLMGSVITRFWLFAGVMVIFGIAKMIFDPTLHAYVGDRVPYERRGFAVGIIELSWAGSLLISAPIAGFLLDVSGISLVFMTLALASLFMTIVIWRVIPSDTPVHDSNIKIITPMGAWQVMRVSPPALGAVASAILLATANEIFFINYSVWMEVSFGLVLTALGVVTIVIAVAEIFGEFSVIGLADRYGKRRLALISSGVAGIMYIVMPHLSFSLPVALMGVFVLFLGVETAIVSSISLFSEILPHARAVMMSSVIGASSAGRLIGALMGGALYEQTNDFVLMGAVAMGIGFLSWFMLWYFVPEQSSNPFESSDQ